MLVNYDVPLTPVEYDLCLQAEYSKGSIITINTINKTWQFRERSE